MTMPSDRERYVARCLRVSAAVQNRGVTLRKVTGQHALEIASAAGSVVFPIVTDERAWRETTIEEAFYVVLLDARGWSGAHVDDASVATLDDVESSEVPLIRRDLSDELARIGRLQQVLGGADRLNDLWETAELTAV